jgi:hypothetical protein
MTTDTNAGAAQPALHWKLVIDAADAPRLADFWAAALGYTVEDPTELITALLGSGRLPEEAIVEYAGRRLFRGYAGIRHPEDSFDPASGVGQGRRILFQQVPEPKSVKNRLHIDVHSGTEDRDAVVARLVALGARRMVERDQGPAGHWWVMLDPEGNEFCVA